MDKGYAVLLLLSWPITQGKPYDKQVIATPFLQKDKANPRPFNEQGTLCISSCLCPRYIEDLLCIYCWLFLRHTEIHVSFHGSPLEVISGCWYPPFGWKRSGWGSLPANRRDITIAGQDQANSRATPALWTKCNSLSGEVTTLTYKWVHTPLISSSLKCLLLQIYCTGTRKKN